MRSRFAIVEPAARWRVQRFRAEHRGQIHIVRDPTGHPLVLPLTTTISELSDVVGASPGRYRLDVLDANSAHGDRELRATETTVETIVPSCSAPSDPAQAACHKSTRETED